MHFSVVVVAGHMQAFYNFTLQNWFRSPKRTKYMHIYNHLCATENGQPLNNNKKSPTKQTQKNGLLLAGLQKKKHTNTFHTIFNRLRHVNGLTG